MQLEVDVIFQTTDQELSYEKAFLSVVPEWELYAHKVQCFGCQCVNEEHKLHDAQELLVKHFLEAPYKKITTTHIFFNTHFV